ncbi:MAG TPA: acyl carrier protein [Nitrospirota bacterium]|nr:acyl carrier protein [Nitrospirota bacterium]
MKKFSRETILRDVIMILKDMPSEWEKELSETIGPETRLFADLSLESIQIVQLAISIERHFQRQGLPFHKLFMSDELDINDLRVSDLGEFLYQCINA